MTQTERLNKIYNIIINNKTIKKHLAPSFQTTCGRAKIIIWDTENASVEAFVDTDKNIFARTIKKLKRENAGIIQECYFVRSDGSCKSYIIFK